MIIYCTIFIFNDINENSIISIKYFGELITSKANKDSICNIYSLLHNEILDKKDQEIL